MVIIKQSNIHGKGVFATENISKDTIITCDILEVPKGKILKEYIYPFVGDRVCIHVGFGSFLNSSKTPNLRYKNIDIEKMISYFEVIENIKIGDEITINYM